MTDHITISRQSLEHILLTLEQSKEVVCEHDRALTSAFCLDAGVEFDHLGEDDQLEVQRVQNAYISIQRSLDAVENALMTPPTAATWEPDEDETRDERVAAAKAARIAEYERCQSIIDEIFDKLGVPDIDMGATVRVDIIHPDDAARTAIEGGSLH